MSTLFVDDATFGPLPEVLARSTSALRVDSSALSKGTQRQRAASRVAPQEKQQGGVRATQRAYRNQPVSVSTSSLSAQEKAVPRAVAAATAAFGEPSEKADELELDDDGTAFFGFDGTRFYLRFVDNGTEESVEFYDSPEDVIQLCLEEFVVSLFKDTPFEQASANDSDTLFGAQKTEAEYPLFKRLTKMYENATYLGRWLITLVGIALYILAMFQEFQTLILGRLNTMQKTNRMIGGIGIITADFITNVTDTLTKKVFNSTMDFNRVARGMKNTSYIADKYTILMKLGLYVFLFCTHTLCIFHLETRALSERTPMSLRDFLNRPGLLVWINTVGRAVSTVNQRMNEKNNPFPPFDMILADFKETVIEATKFLSTQEFRNVAGYIARWGKNEITGLASDSAMALSDLTFALTNISLYVDKSREEMAFEFASKTLLHPLAWRLSTRMAAKFILSYLIRRFGHKVPGNKALAAIYNKLTSKKERKDKSGKTQEQAAVVHDNDTESEEDRDDSESGQETPEQAAAVVHDNNNAEKERARQAAEDAQRAIIFRRMLIEQDKRYRDRYRQEAQHAPAT